MARGATCKCTSSTKTALGAPRPSCLPGECVPRVINMVNAIRGKRSGIAPVTYKWAGGVSERPQGGRTPVRSLAPSGLGVRVVFGGLVLWASAYSPAAAGGEPAPQRAHEFLVGAAK